MRGYYLYVCIYIYTHYYTIFGNGLKLWCPNEVLDFDPGCPSSDQPHCQGGIILDRGLDTMTTWGFPIHGGYPNSWMLYDGLIMVYNGKPSEKYG